MPCTPYLATPMVHDLFSVVCVLVGLYLLRTKVNIVFTRCHILRLKCTKIDFFWGYAQTPLGEAYSAPLAGFKEALLLREGMGRDRKKGEGKKGRGKRREGDRKREKRMERGGT